MNTYAVPDAPWTAALLGIGGPVRSVERASIREFMESHREYLKGRVLDFGAGDQPYRDLVEGDYEPHEKDERFPSGYYDAVMCNQVLQYVDDPAHVLRWAVRGSLKVGGVALITYPTNWDEVEPSDKWRFTKSGMEQLLKAADLKVLAHELRAVVKVGQFSFPLGYGVVCQK